MPGLGVRTGAQGAALFFSPFFLFFFSPPPLCIHQPSLLPLHHRGHLHPLAVFRNCSNFLPCDPTPGSSPRRPQAGAGVSAEPPARCQRRGPSHGREMRLPAPEQRRGGGGDAHPPAPQPLGQHRAASPAAGRWAPRAAPPAGRHPGHAVPAGQCRGGSRGEAVARVSPRGAGSCWAVGCVGGSWRCSPAWLLRVGALWGRHGDGTRPTWLCPCPEPRAGWLLLPAGETEARMGAGMSLLGGKKGAVLGWGPRCPRSGTCCPLPVQLGARQELGSAGAGTGLGMEDGGAAAGRARCPAWAAGGQAGGCPRWQGPVSPALGDTGQTESHPCTPKKAAGRCLGASHLPCLSFPS